MREAGEVNAADLRILGVRADPMEPAPSHGDRLPIETGHRVPETGALCVVWDGNGLLARRAEYVPGSHPPERGRPRVNPRHAPYTRLARDAHLLGTALWKIQPAWRESAPSTPRPAFAQRPEILPGTPLPPGIASPPPHNPRHRRVGGSPAIITV